MDALIDVLIIIAGGIGGYLLVDAIWPDKGRRR